MPDYRAKNTHALPLQLTIALIVGLSIVEHVSAMQDSQPSSATAPTPSPTSAADLPDGRELIRQAIEAIGGREAFEKITSMSIKGSMSAQKVTLSIEIHTAQNGRYIYKQSTLRGGVVSMGSDGTVGWRIKPNTTKYELVEKSVLLETDQQANIHKILLQLEDRFSNIETLSREDFGGKDAYKVSLTTDDGKEQFMFFDAGNQLLLGVKIVDQLEIPYFIQFEDWKTLGDVKLFRKMLLSREGLVLETLFTEITLNETDPAVFEQPIQVKKLVAESKDESNKPAPQTATQPDGI